MKSSNKVLASVVLIAIAVLFSGCNSKVFGPSAFSTSQSPQPAATPEVVPQVDEIQFLAAGIGRLSYIDSGFFALDASAGTALAGRIALKVFTFGGPLYTSAIYIYETTNPTEAELNPYSYRVAYYTDGEFVANQVSLGTVEVVFSPTRAALDIINQPSQSAFSEAMMQYLAGKLWNTYPTNGGSEAVLGQSISDTSTYNFVFPDFNSAHISRFKRNLDNSISISTPSSFLSLGNLTPTIDSNSLKYQQR